MNKQKGLAPLLIIILIAVSLGGYLIYQKQFKPISVSQFSPTPFPTISDETVYTEASRSANWKTYNNNVFKYKISYPSDWKVEDSETQYLEDQNGAKHPVGMTKLSSVDTSISIIGNFQGGWCAGGEQSGCSVDDFVTDSGIKGKRWVRKYENDAIYSFRVNDNNISITYQNSDIELGDKIVKSLTAMP